MKIIHRRITIETVASENSENPTLDLFLIFFQINIRKEISYLMNNLTVSNR